MNIIGGFYNAADELEEQAGNPYRQISLWVLFYFKIKSLIIFNSISNFRESKTKTKAAWIEKLEVIYEMRLRDLDPQLWNHLKTLDISPRLFGLWVRFLFTARSNFSFQEMAQTTLWSWIPILRCAFSLGRHLLRQTFIRNHRWYLCRNAHPDPSIIVERRLLNCSSISDEIPSDCGRS